ncbi:MAG TPA: potassium-transporting ATPase subunit KdpC [Candidatus Binataceae bacterium]|nr:potassium-transporting ATPase subunit KdpC [Candidatus Binataceae bacterium]
MRLMIAIRMTVVLTVLTGIIYPLFMVGVAHVIFPRQAGGSLIYRNGAVVGSSLIGQNFKAPRYFQSRPSAAGNNGYDATSSSGSNLGPTSKSLIDSVKQRLKSVLEENPGVRPSQVPVDLVTASGSGLDPEISPAAADLQVPRVTKARRISEDAVRTLIKEHTSGRLLGFLGEPGVNVVELNLALDALGANQPTALK